MAIWSGSLSVRCRLQRRYLATHHHERVARSGSPLRASDEALEPRMKEYIFGERNGIYIIDLQKTLKMFKEASKFV